MRKSRHSASVRPASRRRSIGPPSVAAAETTGALVRRSARRTPSGGFCSASCSQARNARVVEAVRLRLGQHREQRIDARLDRPLAQQLGAEPVDRVDVRFFERRRARARAAAATPRSAAVGARRSSASRRRSFSSPAAFSVNVTATISVIVARPVASTRRMRFTSSVVLPVPAAASTTSVSSSSSAMASRAPSSSASAPV